MRRVINTPEGPRTVPDWAECYCVVAHRPSVMHPYPFTFPSGEEIWVCPTTLAQVRVLLKFHEKEGKFPGKLVLKDTSIFAQRTARMYVDQKRYQEQDAEGFYDWVEAQRIATDEEYRCLDYIERIKTYVKG